MFFSKSRLAITGLIVAILIPVVFVINVVVPEFGTNQHGDPAESEVPQVSTVGTTLDLLVDDGVSSNNKNHVVKGRDISIVKEQAVDVGEPLRKIAEEFYTNADRVTFVKIDPEHILMNLRYSQAYMYAESGNYPAEVRDSDVPDLILNVFSDREYALSINRVKILENEGRRNLVIQGQVTGNKDSTFRFTSTGDGSMFSGFIDTPEKFTRLDTWKISKYTAVAEFDRSSVDIHSGPID